MKCPLCGNEIPKEASLAGPWEVNQPNIHKTDESGTTTVCGQCFLLVSILDTLKEIRNEIDKRTY